MTPRCAPHGGWGAHRSACGASTPRPAPSTKPLAAAVDAEAEAGERIDIGWDRPVSMREVADVVGSRAGKKIKVWAVPSAVARTAGAVAGRFMPLIADMAAMFRWFETGRYVADPRRQEELFGPVPTAEETLARYTDELRTAQRR